MEGVTNGIFCPKCGAEGQAVDSYCRRCGQWLPDLEAHTRPRLFRKRSREEKQRKRLMLELVSAGLALTAAAVIFSFLSGNGDRETLFLAAFCCLLIAAYQAINLFIGLNLDRKKDRGRVTGDDKPADQTPKPTPISARSVGDHFIEMPSATENTTRELNPPPRIPQRDRQR